MTGYHASIENTVASVLIGNTDEQWTNQYSKITSAWGDIGFVRFKGVYTPGALLGYCADDMSIVPNQ